MAVRQDLIARFNERLKHENPQRSSSAEVKEHLDTIKAMLSTGANRRFIWEFLRDEDVFHGGYASFVKSLRTALEANQSQAPIGNTSEEVL